MPSSTVQIEICSDLTDDDEGYFRIRADHEASGIFRHSSMMYLESDRMTIDSDDHDHVLNCGNEKEEVVSGNFFDVNSDCLPLSTINEEVSGSLFSFDFRNWGDIVYVGIVNSHHEEAGFDALRWTISHLVDQTNPNSLVFLIHIFPVIHQIPTLLGMMPIDQANPEQKKIHLAHERSKRKEYLHKYINICSASKVKVDSLVIETDNKAKAILDLIPILNIKKLVWGTNKRNIKSTKLRGTAGHILRGAPEYCDIKIICEGKEMVSIMVDHSSSWASSPRSYTNSPISIFGEGNHTNLLSCISCFKPKVYE